MAEQNTGKSKFLAAFKKSDKLKKALTALKNARNPNKRPDIPEGNYVAAVRSGVFSEYNGIPRVSVNFQIDRGPQKGTPLQKRYDFGVVSEKSSKTEEEIFERIGQDLIQMGQTLKNATPEALLEAFEALFEEKPAVKITLKANGQYLNVWVNGLAEALEGAADEEETDEEAGDEEAAEESSEETEAEESEETEEVEKEADDEEGDEQPVEVKDRVLYKPKGAKKPDVFSVMASNPAKRTCDLRHAKTNVTFKGVSWDEVDFAEVT